MPSKGPNHGRSSHTPHGKLVRKQGKYIRLPAKLLSPGQTQRMMEAREKQQRAVEMKKAGATLQEIANALGYKHPSGAAYAVKQGIERIGLQPAKELILTDLARLDEYQMRLTVEMRTKNNLSVIPLLLAVMEKRWRLTNLSSEDYQALIAEEAVKSGSAGSVVNNGVMVVQGVSESEFVKGMMAAVGMSPGSPEAKKYIEDLEKRREAEEKEKKNQKALPSGPRSTADGALNRGSQEDEIIEAEIVEEDVV